MRLKDADMDSIGICMVAVYSIILDHVQCQPHTIAVAGETLGVNYVVIDSIEYNCFGLVFSCPCPVFKILKAGHGHVHEKTNPQKNVIQYYL